MNREGASGVNELRVLTIDQESRRAGRATNKRIALLLFENCSFLDAGLIIETFELASVAAVEQYGQAAHSYSVSLLSSRGGRIRCSNDISVETQTLDAALPAAYDALFIVGGDGASDAARDRKTIEWLKRVFQTIRVVQASGNGTLLLRGANLPNARGMIVPIRPAALSQNAASDKALLLDVNAGSPVVTALSLVKTDFDYETAESIAEHLMPFSGRWLAPLLGDPPNANLTSMIKEAARWIEANCDRPITVEDMAQSVSMSERTFLRHFKAKMDMPPSEYLLRIRLDIACRLLITTTLPIDKIARRCGMGSGTRLAKIFKRRLGISATDYRACARAEFVNA